MGIIAEKQSKAKLKCKIRRRLSFPYFDGNQPPLTLHLMSFHSSVEDDPSRLLILSEAQGLLAPSHPPEASLLEFAPGSTVLELLDAFAGRAAAT